MLGVLGGYRTSALRLVSLGVPPRGKISKQVFSNSAFESYLKAVLRNRLLNNLSDKSKKKKGIPHFSKT